MSTLVNPATESTPSPAVPPSGTLDAGPNVPDAASAPTASASPAPTARERARHLNLLRMAGYHHLIASALMGAFEAFWLKDLNFDEQFIGTYILATGMSALTGHVLWGWVTDRWGQPARVSALGSFLFGALALMFPLLKTQSLLLGFALTKGLLMTMATSMIPVLVAAVAEPGKEGKTYSQYRIFGTYGFLTATVGLPYLLKDVELSAFGVRFVSIQILFVIAAVAMLVAGLPLLFYRLPTHTRRSRVSSGTGGLARLFRTPELVGFFIATFFFSLANPANFTYLTTYARSMGADPQFVGLMTACLGVVGLTCLRVMGWVTDRTKPRYILWVAFAAQPLRVLSISFISDNYAYLMLPQFFHILTWAGPEVALIYFLGRLAGDEHRGKALGIYMSVTMLGQMVGAPLTGMLIAAHGYPFAYRAAAAISSLGFVAFTACILLMARSATAVKPSLNGSFPVAP